MSNKKDLTRIEDLGEFLHELGNDEELTPETNFGDSEVPDLPESESSFETEFGSNEEVAFTEESILPDFGSDFQTEASLEEEEPVETTFETSDFALEETPVESEPVFEEKSSWEETPLEDITPEPVYTPSPAETTTESFKAPETFGDLRKFSESTNLSGMSAEGNPSFSVLLKNVRYIEDVNDITSLLKELGLLADSEEQVKSRLMRGMLLVPRISEYAAIYLAHKLRRFDIDIQIGPSDEIHPPKHQETPETGIVSKFNLYQNQNHHFYFDDPKLELSQIIIAATPALEGYQVLRYLGVASEHKLIDSHIVEDEGSDEIPQHYQELAQRLKAHALKAHSNAVVGLNYQLTPIPSEYGTSGHKYRLTCTGNLVWVNKL